MNVIQDVATLYSVLQNVTGASGQVSIGCHLYMAEKTRKSLNEKSTYHFY